MLPPPPPQSTSDDVSEEAQQLMLLLQILSNLSTSDFLDFRGEAENAAMFDATAAVGTVVLHGVGTVSCSLL